MPKPELGKVAVGDRLLVIPASYGRVVREPIYARVTKVGRVWVDLAEVSDAGRVRAWRLRLDTQDNPSGYSQRDRFVTADQYAWEEQQSAVHAYLREQRVMPESDSPWRSEERMLTLANLMRQYDGLDSI